MIVLSPTVAEGTSAAVPEEWIGLSTPAIDRSSRITTLVLFTAAATWLCLGALFGLISAIKAHGPGFLASFAWLTYGRVRPVAANALVYGFAVQAALGVALWLSC